MGLAATLAAKSLFGRPGRTAFSVLGVALGIATVVGVFTLDHSTVLSRTQALDESWGGVDLEVKPSGALDDPKAELLALEGVAGVAAFFQNDALFRPLVATGAAGEDDAFDSVRLIALEAAQAPSLGVYFLERGRAMEPGKRELLLGRALAERHGLSPGDRVLVGAPLRAARKACVDGVLQTVEEGASGQPAPEAFVVAGVMAFEGIGRRSGGELVVVDYDAGRRLFADLFVESRFWLRREQASDLEAIEAALGRGFSFERNARSAAGQMADERAFRNGVRVAGLFALLLGLFVIFHTLSMSLLERLREVGTLHSLGASLAQIGRVFFLEALFVATAAGVLGLLGGLGLAWVLLENGISTLGVGGRPVRPFAVPWRTVVPLVGLGVGVALLGSVYPILRARGTDVTAVLRGERTPGRRPAHGGFHLLTGLLLLAVVPAAFFLVAPVVGAADPVLVRLIVIGLGVLGLIVGLPLLLPGPTGRLAARLLAPFRGLHPLAVSLAARSLAGGGTRVGAAIAAMALVACAFVGLRGMTESLAGEFSEWGERAVVDKVWVTGLPDARLDELEAELAEVPGVVAVENGDARVHADFLLLGLDPAPLAAYGPLRDPALLERFRDEQTVVVSTRLAQQRQLELGDSVLLNTSGHGVQRFAVIAISDAYGYFPHPDERAYAVTAQRHVARFFCIDVATTTRLAVRLDRRRDYEAVAAFLRARFPAERLNFNSGPGIVRLHLADIRRDFFLFDVILGLTAALAGLGVLNGLLLAALERKKELGILRALGTTDAQIAGTVLYESAVLGLVGGVLGVLAGLALTPVLISSLRVLSGLDLPPRNAGAWCLAVALGALLLALASGLYPIQRMLRTNAVEAVRS